MSERSDFDALTDRVLNRDWASEAIIAEVGHLVLPRARFKRWGIDELVDLPAPRWLVDGWASEEALVEVYGKTNGGKTFLVLDLALCIAMGLPWCGRGVLQGRVLYVAAEGEKARFTDRIRAWCRFHNIDLDALRGRFDVVFDSPKVDLSEEVKAFIEADPKKPLRLTVLDTAAETMSGDENSTADMSRYVAGAKAIKRHYGGAVVVVHHTGKDETKGSRGSTALIGATDSIIAVSNPAEGRVRAYLEKNRDGERGASVVLQMVPVVVDEETLRGSVALRSDEGGAPSNAAEQLLVMLAERPGQTVTRREDMVDPHRKGFSRANVNKGFQWMVAEGYLTGTGPFNLTPKGKDKALALGAGIPE